MIKYFLIGFVIGIAKIIPGVSGAVIAIIFGVYEKGLDAITHFFRDIKRNSVFLFSIGLGIFCGIFLFSNIIKFFIDNYYLLIMLLFTGLIFGGTLNVSKNVKKDKVSYVIIYLSLIIILFLGVNNIFNSYVIKNNFIDYLVYFISGFVEAIGTVIPGVSSTALLMIIGVYDIFINAIANIYDISNLIFILFFGFGLFIGIILISLVMDYLFKKHKKNTYDFIIGISIGSVILMLFKSFAYSFSSLSFIVGFLLFIIGFVISYCVNLD